MKYMGHKGKMLPILGDILINESSHSNIIADPFCGSASVSWFLACNTEKQIIAGDLQSFASNRAAAVIERNTSINMKRPMQQWFARARALSNSVLEYFPNHLRSVQPSLDGKVNIERVVLQSRAFCADVLPPLLSSLGGNWAISKAYGGFYFSPYQALVIDSLRRTLPRKGVYKKAALAALVDAASRCAAAPGHTAQPFQPTDGAAPYIVEFWKKDVFFYTQKAIEEICALSASEPGRAVTGNFSETLEHLDEGDLVFADPPYSGVHYSRFYHVLETIVRGVEINFFGQGRYPPLAERPSSEFSKKAKAHQAASELVELCCNKGLKLVVTFPTDSASNGLTAKDFINMGQDRFSSIEEEVLESNFSTLGGNQVVRDARKVCSESILIFRP